MLICDLTLPLKTVSEMNVRTHWAVRAKRMKEHRFCAKSAVAGVAKTALPPFMEWPDMLPLVVVLTRYSAGRLDDDNLRSALKGVRDGVAEAIGINDADARVSYHYQQERCQRNSYAVGIKLCDSTATV